MYVSPENPQEFYRWRDAAHYLGVSESLLRRWEREGYLKAIKVPGVRATRIHVTEVRSLAARIQNGSLERDPQEVA